MTETHKFKEFIFKDTEFLFLGSFTANSIKSDSNYNWYYSSKFNQFWKILEHVYNVSLKTKSQKQGFFRLMNFGIADIIYSCVRSNNNSSDINLTSITYNSNLSKEVVNSSIKTIFFTSKFVEKKFTINYKELISKIPLIQLATLPSPSPRPFIANHIRSISHRGQVLQLHFIQKILHCYSIYNFKCDKIVFCKKFTI